MKKYWISTTHWSLIDSMATESISPFSFYIERGFGSDLSRYISGSERMNHIILSDFEPSCDFAIEVDESILDLEALVRTGKKSHISSYPKSIHFRKGHVRFRFKDEMMMKQLLSEAEIMLEEKCTDLYRDDFYVSNTGEPLPLGEEFDCLALESQKKAIIEDQRRNYLKGAIIGYARGRATSMSIEDTSLIQSLTEIRNSVGGLHTRVMIDDTFRPGNEIINKIDETEGLFMSSGHGTSRSFSVIRHLIGEFIRLAYLRSDELSKRKVLNMDHRIGELRKQEAQCELEIDRIEYGSILGELKAELENIKNEEALRGVSEGKKRKFFPKGSPEYDRKHILKDLIANAEKNKGELKALRSEISSIKSEIANISSETTKYDGALAPLANKISDAISGLIGSVKSGSSPVNIDLSGLTYIDGQLRVAGPEGASKAEVEFFSFLFEDILNHPLNQLRKVSDADVIDILIRTCKAYVATSSSFHSESGQRIRDVMLSLLYFKKHDPRGKVLTPDDMPLLSAIVPFFVKCQDFAQIERFMENRKMSHKEFPLMLWAAFVGFASIPRTMTEILYNNSEQYRVVEDKIHCCCLRLD